MKSKDFNKKKKCLEPFKYFVSRICLTIFRSILFWELAKLIIRARNVINFDLFRLLVFWKCHLLYKYFKTSVVKATHFAIRLNTSYEVQSSFQLKTIFPPSKQKILRTHSYCCSQLDFLKQLFSNYWGP